MTLVAYVGSYGSGPGAGGGIDVFDVSADGARLTPLSEAAVAGPAFVVFAELGG